LEKLESWRGRHFEKLDTWRRRKIVRRGRQLESRWRKKTVGEGRDLKKGERRQFRKEDRWRKLETGEGRRRNCVVQIHKIVIFGRRLFNERLGKKIFGKGIGNRIETQTENYKKDIKKCALGLVHIIAIYIHLYMYRVGR
jgi:hypothetical protein